MPAVSRKQPPSRCEITVSANERREWRGVRRGEAPRIGMKRIRLVEDEAGLVLTLTDRLSKEGYAVDSAGDGESGLERATREAFDLLLLDLMLPRMSGFDVCRELRRRGIETPVVMLTARGQV